MTHDNEKKKELMSFREACELYENGKHRRYELLFAVNGGAFAVAKLLGVDRPDLGRLHPPQIAAGMIVFTIAMVVDLYTFGMNWHARGKEIDKRDEYEIFGGVGRGVLIVIGLLLCAGWALASGWFGSGVASQH